MDHDTAETAQIAPPSAVHLTSDRRSLRVVWEDDGYVLAASFLRAACRSSDALRAQIDGREAETPHDLTIERVELVGSYALNLAFSDGEDRGIYPWRFLRALADTQSATESN